MIKRYFKGNAEQGSNIIAELEKLGGINEYNANGENPNGLYYINNDNNIDYCDKNSKIGKIITECFEEIKIEDIKKDLFVIQGVPDIDKGLLIIKFLTSIGGKNVRGYGGIGDDYYYFINSDNEIDIQEKDSDYFKNYNIIEIGNIGVNIY